MTIQDVFQPVLDTIDNVTSVLTFGALKNAEELKVIRKKKAHDYDTKQKNHVIRQSTK